MKFGQLIEYKVKNIFLKNAQNVVEKVVPDPFIKNNQNCEHISGSTV